MFCHDPESWKELWVGDSGMTSGNDDSVRNLEHIDGPVFSSNSVKLDTVLKEMKSGDGEQAWILVWSITRP